MKGSFSRGSHRFVEAGLLYTFARLIPGSAIPSKGAWKFAERSVSRVLPPLRPGIGTQRLDGRLPHVLGQAQTVAGLVMLRLWPSGRSAIGSETFRPV
ncbi:MAG TPA: hypothetical protein VMX16_08775 [Terriglobia bacterium]|nr:hypothetical protein [Terriglobia bacterium]